MLIFCADLQKWIDSYHLASCHPRNPKLLTVEDVLCVAQNTVTAAWSFGIGSCYIGYVMEQYEPHREILVLLGYVYPAAIPVFGHPTPQQTARVKPARFAMKRRCVAQLEAMQL